MSLLTVEDYMAAAGIATVTDLDRAKIQYYIDTISGYIEKITGTTFSRITDEVQRVKSDSEGRIVLEVSPITDVSQIAEYRSGDVITDWCWDGLDEIDGLCKNKTYEVTYSYGVDPVPSDIVGVATEAVKRGMASVPTGLKMKTVGDVSYQYGEMLNFTDQEQAVLDQYNDVNTTTWSISTSRDAGRSSYPNYILNGPDWGDY